MVENRSRLICRLFCGIGLFATGCVTPQYLMPSGYSSTYQKAMTQDQISPGKIVRQTAPLNPEKPDSHKQ